MLVLGGGALSIDVPNATVLALSPTLPLLVLAYARLSLQLRLLRPEFGLRKSELAELNRALLLHDRVRFRIQKLHELSPRCHFWRALIGERADVAQEHVVESEDLQTYAEFLETVILRLRCKPLQRLKRWIGLKSRQSALGRTLATACFALLTIMIVLSFYRFGPMGFASAERVAGIGNGLAYANAVAAGLAIVAAPLFYFGRRIKLRRQYSLELCLFRDLASVGRGSSIEQATDEDDRDWLQWVDEEVAANEWRSVLRVSQSAGIEEIRAAYRQLVKQCHPDRVHGMSEAFRRLADVETKKLNSAYRQALLAMAADRGG